MLLRISEDGEFYVDETGQAYHRVSRILRTLGISRAYFGVSGVYRERGRAVHLACQLLNEGRLREDSLDPQIRPYVDAYRAFLEDSYFNPLACEVSCASIHGFAGTIDVVGMLNGDLTLLDFKTGESIDPAVEYQTGAYEILWNENRPQQLIQKRCALQLKGKGSYKLHPMKKRAEVFLQAYQTFLASNPT